MSSVKFCLFGNLSADIAITGLFEWPAGAEANFRSYDVINTESKY
jgi:hypothetical protein